MAAMLRRIGKECSPARKKGSSRINQAGAESRQVVAGGWEEADLVPLSVSLFFVPVDFAELNFVGWLKILLGFGDWYSGLKSRGFFRQ